MSVSISGDGSVTGIDQGLNVVGVVTATTISVGSGTSVSSPATNVLALGTNNTERFCITGIGSVGINSTSPNSKLDVVGSVLINNSFADWTAVNVTEAKDYRIAFRIGPTRSGGSEMISMGHIQFGGNSASAIQAVNTSTNTASTLYLNPLNNSSVGLVAIGSSLSVGTSESSYKLQVTGRARNNNNYGILHIRDEQTLTGTAGTGGIFLSSSPGTDYYIAKGYTGSDTKLVFGNGNNGTEFMRIDSSGRITTPYQPAFNAYINASTHNNWTGSANSIFPFSLANLNVGNHYNTSSYRFTAPVAGNYFFYFCLSRVVDSGFSAGLRVNNGNGWICVLELNQTISGSSWITHSASSVIGLSAGDYVEAQVISVTTTGTAFADGSGTYPTIIWDAWGGYLVG